MLVVREGCGEGKTSIRLRCPKTLVQELNMPEKGLVMVHVKRYSFQARCDVSGSSFRVNLGKAFSPLLYDEDGKISVTFKLFNGVFEMFYKEREASIPASDK